MADRCVRAKRVNVRHGCLCGPRVRRDGVLKGRIRAGIDVVCREATGYVDLAVEKAYVAAKSQPRNWSAGGPRVGSDIVDLRQIIDHVGNAIKTTKHV